MRTQSVKSGGPGAPKTVPSPGSVSAVGPSGKAPPPRIKTKNTRDYGKTAPHPASAPAPVDVFGDSGGF